MLAAFAAKNLAPDGYTLPAYAAGEVAIAALAGSECSGKPLADALTGHDFTTAIGPLRFDDKGDLTRNLYRAFRFNGTRFVPAETN